MTMAVLQDRVALITGASRGIGAALALELAKLGAQCVLVARTQGGLEEVDDAIRAAGGKPATLLPFDLQKAEKDIDMIGPSIVERFGRLDILVHNAGALNKLTPVAHIEPRDWAEVMAVNLTGRVLRPRAYWGMYGASKAGMEHLVMTWAQEVEATPLRVNLVDPDIVATKMRAAAMPGEDPATIPQPADVAPGIAALCLPSETRHGARVLIRG